MVDAKCCVGFRVFSWAFKVEDGAMVIDINLDDGLLDGMAAMQKFCKIAVTEPDVSKVTPALL